MMRIYLSNNWMCTVCAYTIARKIRPDVLTSMLLSDSLLSSYHSFLSVCCKYKTRMLAHVWEPFLFQKSNCSLVWMVFT